jgi:hypothetical protein
MKRRQVAGGVRARQGCAQARFLVEQDRGGVFMQVT